MLRTRRNAIQLLLRNCVPSTPPPRHEVALVIGHHHRAMGAWGQGKIKRNEFAYNKESIAPLFVEEAKKYGIDLKVFYRSPISERALAWSKMQAAPEEGSFSVDDIIQGKAGGFGKVPPLVLEAHFNHTGSSKSKRRYTCMVATGKKGSSRDKAKDAAGHIQRTVCKAFERPAWNYNTGTYVFSRGYAYQFDTPWVLLEPAFGNVEDDANLLDNKKLSYVRATLAGTLAYLDAQAIA